MKNVVDYGHSRIYRAPKMPLSQPDFHKRVLVCNPDFYIYREMQMGLADYRNDNRSWEFIVDECWPALSRAKHYLGYTGKTVEEISVMCGFSEPNLFYTQFRKREGTSPREWWREHLSGRREHLNVEVNWPISSRASASRLVSGRWIPPVTFETGRPY